jgi:cytochrome c553
MRPFFLLLGAVFWAAASPVVADQLTVKEAASARKLYVAKCAKCHKFQEPKNYPDADWEVWIGKMSRRSKLKADQEEALKRYLADYRAGRIEKVR